MRPATTLASLALVAALLLGCGGSGETTTSPQRAPNGATSQACPAAAARTEGLKVTGADCAEARRVMAGWVRQHDCRPATGSSRSGCPVGSYRCVATATGRGWSVSCAEPGKSVAFTFRRG
jgi:hypothetical protein